MCAVNCLFGCLCTYSITCAKVHTEGKGIQQQQLREQKIKVMVYFDFSVSYSFLFFYKLDSITSIALVYQTNFCECVHASSMTHKSKNKTIEIPFILQKVCVFVVFARVNIMLLKTFKLKVVCTTVEIMLLLLLEECHSNPFRIIC